MYTPRHFDIKDLGVLDVLFRRDAFVTLVTVDDDGKPFASHLPVLYQRDGERVLIRGHWSRANPQARATQKALIIVHGPHGYISPTWYTDPQQQVPTWNYATAHLSGALTIVDDVDRLQTLVAELAAVYESGDGDGWQFPASAPSKQGSLRGIVGFELEASTIEIKCKFNQNHPEANRHSAIQALRARGSNDQELADWMEWLNFGRPL